MINLVYLAFFYLLIAEAIVFILLTVPIPFGFKATLVRVFMGSKVKSSLMWAHFAICFLAVLFLVDLGLTQNKYAIESERLKALGNGHVGTEVRMGYVSYQTQRIQRNQYITTMLIYVSIVLNLYVRMLHHVYKQRGDYDGLPTLEEKQKQYLQEKQQEKTKINAEKKGSLLSQSSSGK